MIGFMIWAIMGVVLIGIGVFAFFARRPMGFWANVEPFAVSDCWKYNCAVGKLFCVFGLVFIVLGLPLLMGQNSPFVLLSILGIVLESIVAMAVYALVIEKKYRKKK